MPTKKQLSERWASERFFGNTNESYNVRGSHMAGSGNDLFVGKFEGEAIGIIEVDEKTKMLKIIPFKWIDVSQRTPEPYVMVIVKDENENSWKSYIYPSKEWAYNKRPLYWREVL